jgi:hypothetical protein
VRAWVLAIVLAACGRIGFREHDGGGSGGSADSPRLIVVAGAGSARVDDVSLDDAGNVALLGGFTGTVELAGTSAPSAATMNDLYVAVVDASNALVWLWTAGCSTVCNSQGIKWLAGELITGGYFEGTLANGGGQMSGTGQNALIMWFDPGGDGVQNAAHFGGTRNVQIRGLDAAGSTLAVTGVYADTMDFGQGAVANAGTNDNAFVAVFGTDGTFRYSRTFNGSGDIYGNDIAVAPDGSVCVTGRYMATTDFGGGTATPNSHDGYIVKLDAQGAFQWQVSPPNVGAELGAYVATASNGDCIVLGEYDTTQTWSGTQLLRQDLTEVFVARLAAADGSVRWVHTIYGPGNNHGVGLATDARDRIALAASFSGTSTVIDRSATSDGSNDLAVFLLGGNGDVLEYWQLGGAGAFQDNFGGASFDPSGTHAAFSVAFSGELVVHDLELSAFASDGDGVVFAIPSR